MPTTQSLSNRSPAGASGSLVIQMSLNCRILERTGNQLAKGAVLSEIPAPRGALRSCPAGLIAEVGLRWCGARPSST